jgi:hypothetical protein
MVRKTMRRKQVTHRRRATAKRGKSLSKGASNWNKKVMEIYRKMKAENPETKLGDAMRRASQLKKKGQL